jgi:hypothetical protein
MSEAPAYVPDERDDPAWWTARKLKEERRPPYRTDGSGGPRTLWSICTGCGTQRAVNPIAIDQRGHGDRPLAELKWKCRSCRDPGQPKLTWVNPPRVRLRRNDSVPRPGKPRIGWFNLTTGEKHGGWD